MSRVLLALLTGASLVLSACGGTGKTDRQVGGTSVVGDTGVLQGALVSKQLIERQPQGSPQQALMRFWSSLQYQAWPDAASTYEPGLVGVVGEERLVNALTQQGSYFRSTRPTDLSVLTGAGRTTVRFIVKATSGDAVSRSITFRRMRDRWRIFYDPFLDEALQSSVQTATQLTLDPGASKASPQAIAAGDAAARLQAKWLQQASARRPASRKR